MGVRWLLVVATLMAASCSAGDGSSAPSSASASASLVPTATASAGDDGELVFEQPDEPVAPPEALSPIVTGVGVDATGAPVGVTANFPADAAQITAVVDVGPLDAPSTELVVSWFHLGGPAPAEPIFEHRIEVRAGDRAFSTGISSGTLALGRYEVVATIADTRRTAVWMVSEKRSDARHALQVGASPTPPPGPPPDADDGAGEPLVPGDSGTVSGAPAPGAADDGCNLSVTQFGAASAFVTATGCPGSTTEIAAGPSAGALRVIGTAAGDFSRPAGPDPCAVGASDLPQAEMMIAARIASGPDVGVVASIVLQLGPDENGPGIAVDASPAERTLVFPGETIQMKFELNEVPGIGASGVGKLKVTAGDGAVLLDTTLATTATPCDKTRLQDEVPLTVTVPADAGDIFWLHVLATDLAGNTTPLDLAWPTRADWLGTIEADVRATTSAGFDPPNVCAAWWQLLIDIPVDGHGPVRGRAEVQATRSPQCVPWGFGGEARGRHTMTITGTFDGAEFRLSFHSPIPAGGVDVALYTMYYPELQTIVAPVRQRIASAPFVFTHEDAPTEYIATLDGYLFLFCEQCATGG